MTWCSIDQRIESYNICVGCSTHSISDCAIDSKFIRQSTSCAEHLIGSLTHIIGSRRRDSRIRWIKKCETRTSCNEYGYWCCYRFRTGLTISSSNCFTNKVHCLCDWTGKSQGWIRAWADECPSSGTIRSLIPLISKCGA